MDCNLMEKFNKFFVPIEYPISSFGKIKAEVRDLDFITNLDANMPLNWFDLR